jgi:hypothetical protein
MKFGGPASVAKIFFTIALMGVVCLSPKIARADDAAAAQALFNDAKRLVANGDYRAACPKFAESQRLDAGIGTLFNLAECNQHVGKLASAWAEYLEVAAESKTSHQPAREKVARERAAAIESKIQRMTLIVTRTPPGLEIKRDGEVVGAAEWNTAIPVDAGEHTVQASAPGKKTWATTTMVMLGEPTTRIEIPALQDAEPIVAVVSPPAPVTAGSNDSSAQPDSPKTTLHRGNTQRAVGGTILGAGVVGLGVGAAFGFLSKTSHDDAESHCAGNVCDAAGVSYRNDARTRGDVSTIAFATGGGAVLIGAIVMIAAPSSTTIETAHVHASPWIGSDHSGIVVTGAF